MERLRLTVFTGAKYNLPFEECEALLAPDPLGVAIIIGACFLGACGFVLESAGFME